MFDIPGDQNELYKQNKAEELEPIEKAMKTMKNSIEKMMNSITEVKRLHLLEVEKKEEEIRVAKSELGRSSFRNPL